MSDGLKSILRKAAFAAALAIGLASGAAQAATLYISEFGNGVSQIGSATAQVYPQAAIADQTVNLSGSTALSAAFNSATRAVMLMCDEGCSIKFGASTVTAATTNFLLQQGVRYQFAVAQGTYVAAIANAAGNIPGEGTGTPTDVTIVGVGGNAVTTTIPTSGAGGKSVASMTRPANTTTYTVNSAWCSTITTCSTVYTFANACRATGGEVLIPEIDIYSSANPTLKLQGILWLFNTTPGTVLADDATFTLTSADFANLTGGSTNGLAFTLGTSQGGSPNNSGVSLVGNTYAATCSGTSLYGMVQVVNAYVPASAEVLTIKVRTVGVN